MSTESTDSRAPEPGWIPLAAFAPLRPAEQLLLRAYVDGGIARVGLRRPVVPSSELTIRGEFISYLARGGRDTPFALKPLQVVGAWIDGRVDLRHATVPESLWFFRCVFNATPRLEGARCGGNVSFPGSLLPGLRAEDCAVAGSLDLNSGCIVRTEVRLARATIGEDLNLDRLQLRSAERSDTPFQRRLSADGARIDGNALLAGGLESDGDLRLVGVRVAGDLRASRARVSGDVDDEGSRGVALNLDQARIAGSVLLDHGFSASGVVRLKQARIAGDLDCTGAAFDALGDIAWRGHTTLALDRARIGGTLGLARQVRPLHGVSLAAADAQVLADDATTWGEPLTLDGFQYRQFATASSAEAAFRIDWLKRQPPAHMDKDYKDQPWRQLIRVLRRAGRHDAAREVAVARESHTRRIGRVGASAPRGLRWAARAGHGVLGLLVGYGYRPLRVVACLAVMWLACGALYWAAAENGAIAPANPAVYNDPLLAHCRAAAPSVEPVNWTRCPELPAEHPAFRPFAYSLDLLLPFVDLRQREVWTSLDSHRRGGRSTDSATEQWGVVSRVAAWYEGLVGWLALALLGWWVLRRFERDR